MSYLVMSRVSYGDSVGKFTGKITFDNPKGEILLNLTEEQCHDILNVCSAGIISTAKEAAKALVDSAIAGTKFIEENTL